jgi:uncharacterized protein YkwD
LKLMIPAILALSLAACTGAGTLAPGLTARMDAPGATLDRASALNIVNQFRATRGAHALVADAALDARAQALATEYATTGTAPRNSGEAAAIRVSAGYADFAETFSGWRNSEADARALIDPAHTRAGIGVAYTPNSAYGVHWVMLFGTGLAVAAAD